jgi:uncharacterized membrane protein YdjX (TVP38/TMEM64 family)
MSSPFQKEIYDDSKQAKLRSSSLVNGKTAMNGKEFTNEALVKRFSTPYKRMDNDLEYDPYNEENSSDMHNISIAEAYEHEWDTRRTVIGFVLILLMATIIFLVIFYKGILLDQVNNFTETIQEFPVSTIILYCIIMTILISASVPSAIPQVFGSYVFVHAFGFINGFWLMVLVDYISMLIGWVPPFLLARYLLKSWVHSYTSDKPKLYALSMALSKNAKKLVSLMRMCALTPYVVFNIVCGITDMTLMDYWIGNLAIIFWDAPYIYICCSISKITHGVKDTSAGAIIEFIVIIISVVIVLGVAVYVYKIAQFEADRIMEQRKSSALARKTRSRTGRASDQP